ncbi:hypothetical protein [Leadbetterella sp. DM7]|uniref:hypothetical protein n=1 Tax=Leadbetterella sp. DM7 TaxID=3235085 RepID=UPI00349E67DC
MLQADALILLIHSLSASEKKKFRTGRKKADYTLLYDIIEASGTASSDEIKTEFKKKKGGSFSATVTYLYKTLLDSLLALRENQDSHYALFNQILKSRILFEKSLFEEAISLLEQVKKKARHHENPIALLFASRLELEYLLFLNLPDLSERDLLNKHFQINETLKDIRKINEHSSLYELLRHRIIYKGNIRSQKQKDMLNDLVISEMSINSSHKDSFEIRKNHLLFQSNYLIGTGDYKSALHSFRELNRLFESHPLFWSSQPFYYVSVLEGILDNLRSMKSYNEMPYFIGQLRNIRVNTEGLQNQINALTFLYELFPLLDRGDFEASKALTEKYKDTVLARKENLSLVMRAEISLYLSLIHIGFRNFKLAQKTLLSEIVRGNNIYILPSYRTIRLVNLIIHYELDNTDIVHFESRSIKREISKVEKAYRVEHLMLSFLGKEKKIRLPREREKLWKKYQPVLEELRSDVFENQLLKSFDFTAWVEASIKRVALGEVLRGRATG